jgi:hypothetical protein
MTYPAPEPTPDEVPDGTQPVDDSGDFPDEEGDAGIGDAEIEYDEDPFADDGGDD